MVSPPSKTGQSTVPRHIIVPFQSMPPSFG